MTENPCLQNSPFLFLLQEVQQLLSTGGASSSLNQSSFEKGDLQSTLLDEDKFSRPDLDLSAINGKRPPVLNSCFIIFNVRAVSC